MRAHGVVSAWQLMSTACLLLDTVCGIQHSAEGSGRLARNRRYIMAARRLRMLTPTTWCMTLLLELLLQCGAWAVSKTRCCIRTCGCLCSLAASCLLNLCVFSAYCVSSACRVLGTSMHTTCLFHGCNLSISCQHTASTLHTSVHVTHCADGISEAAAARVAVVND